MNLISHYTSADKAILEILPKKRLKFNELKNSNDPWEYKRNIYARFGENILNLMGNLKKMDELNTYIDNIKSICFTNDFPTENRCFCNRLMWAHYGDNHKGVCLVFDRDKLINLLKKSDNGLYLDQPDEIIYSSTKPKSIAISGNEDIKDFVKNNSDEILFTKNEVWGYEKEFRLVYIPNKEKISNKDLFIDNISDALEAIFIGGNISKIDQNAIRVIKEKNYSNSNLYKMLWDKNGFFRISDLDNDSIHPPCYQILK